MLSFHFFFKGTIENDIRNGIISQAPKVLNDLNLALTKETIASKANFPEPGITLDLDLVTPPNVTSAAVGLNFDGRFFVSQAIPNCQTNIDAVPQEMGSIYVHNCMIDSLFASLFKLGKLNSGSHQTTILGKPVLVNVSASIPPTVSLQQSSSFLLANLSVFVTDLNLKWIETVNIALKVPFNVYANGASSVFANVSSITALHTTLTNSSGTYDISKLDFFIDLSLDREVVPMINSALAKGFSLPPIFPFNGLNVVVKNNYLVINFDISKRKRKVQIKL